MGKRGRSLLDVAGSLEELLSSGRSVEIKDNINILNNEYDENSQNSNSTSKSKKSTSNSSSSSSSSSDTIINRRKINLNLSNDQADSQKSTGSAFTTELSFFSREEEDISDMCLYLARTVSSSARTPEALIALVNHFLKYGSEVLMLSLKRSGMQPQLFNILCKVNNQNEVTDEYQQTFLRFFVFIVKLSETEVLCEPTVIRFLLLHCHKNISNSLMESPIKLEKKPLHWSQQIRNSTKITTTKILPQPQRQTDFSKLKLLIDSLCGFDNKISIPSLALQALLEIVFRQNSSLTLPTEINVCLMFVNFNGFNIVSSLLKESECADALHLLEAITLCEGLRSALHVLDLQKTVISLVHLIANNNNNNDIINVNENKNNFKAIELQEEGNAALRVLTNVTNLVPSVLSELPHEGEKLASVIVKTLTNSEAKLDTLAFTLCLSTNIVKWEAREHCDIFTRNLMKFPSFLSRVVFLTFRAYHKEDTEQNVVAGYYALFLAVLSLCSSSELQLRIPVMTAVAQATNNKSVGKLIASKPMTIIVAILQEFLLFQSSAGSLTRESLVSMSNIIDCVIKENGIEVSTDD